MKYNLSHLVLIAFSLSAAQVRIPAWSGQQHAPADMGVHTRNGVLPLHPVLLRQRGSHHDNGELIALRVSSCDVAEGVDGVTLRSEFISVSNGTAGIVLLEMWCWWSWWRW